MTVGETVTLGSYPQGMWKKKKRPLEWRVLDVRDGMALLLTDKVIDGGPYHPRFENMTWENCLLREWLNDGFSGFLNDAFDAEQRGRLVEIQNANVANPKYGTDGGAETKDKVFLLSIDETKRYFPKDADMKAYATRFAVKQGVYADKYTRGSYWWLRSPGRDERYAAVVMSTGGILDGGLDLLHGDVGIRPAVWVKM